MSGKLRLPSVTMPVQLPLWKCFLAFLVPGLALSMAEFPRLLRAWGFFYGICFILALGCVGYHLAGLAWGLMVGLHAMGILFLSTQKGWRPGFYYRCTGILAITGLLQCLIYGPIRSSIEAHGIMPVLTENGVVVLSRLVRPQDVKRGEVIGYRIPERSEFALRHEVILEAGIGLERVIGLPHDLIVFGPTYFEVQGVAFTNLVGMPTSGEFVVPSHHWFIWTSFRQYARHVSAQQIDAVRFEVASVDFDHFLGKPFKSWFGIRQILP